MNAIRLLPVFLSILVLASCTETSPVLFEYKSDKTLKEALEDTEFAITEKNFRITGYLHIGKGIRERGDSKFPMYEMILFCNLSYAKEMLGIDPTYVNYCPQRISIREDGNKIIIGTLLLPEKTASHKMNIYSARINSILREIIRFAAVEDPFLLDEEDEV